MGMTNTEQLKVAEKHLGEGCRTCCSMANNCCAYFVSSVFKQAKNASLFYDGFTVTYCPNAIKWCKANLAQIPLMLAMPSDIIFFDWNKNDVPDHIGFVDHRISASQIATLEGNTTSRYVVARQIRPAKYVLGIYRPHFKATYDLSKPLEIDGVFGYNSIAMLQLVLGIKVDGILGKDTVKAIQKKAGVTADGIWGVGTSKAVQKMIGVKDDGIFGEDSVKALQKWINVGMGKTTTEPAKTAPTANKTATAVSVDTGKLMVDGIGGKATVKALQKFLGSTQDGVISGQSKDLAKYYPSLTAVEYGKGGSNCVKLLQKWLGIAQDGIWGEGTSKALQKKLGVTADGIFGVNSMKALQKYLNSHDKATFPAKEKLLAKAKELAWAKGTKASKYAYKGGSPTAVFKTALNKIYPNRSSWGEAPKVGAACDVYTGVVINSAGIGVKNYPRGLNEQMKYKNADVFERKTYYNVAPYDVSQRGDVIMYYKTKDGSSKHTLIRGDGVLYEAQLKSTYGHVNTSMSKIKTKRPYVVILRAK